MRTSNVRFRSSLLLVAAFVGFALLGAPTQGHAAFTLTLHETGFSDVTITDNGAGDVSLASGAITFSGQFGDFFLQVTTGSSNSSTGMSPAELTINSLSVTTATASSLTLTLADTGFTAPAAGPVSVQSQLSTTMLPQGTTLTYQSTVDGQTGTQLSLSAVDGSVVFNSATLGNNPYTITSVTTLNLNAAGTVQTTGITSVSAVPAPAGLVLALAGLPALGLGACLRRRKKA